MRPVGRASFKFIFGCRIGGKVARAERQTKKHHCGNLGAMMMDMVMVKKIQHQDPSSLAC
jgi:hypothetical protein